MEKINVEEIWKPVLGYEGLYEASSLGNVRSLNYNHTGKTKVLKPSLTRKGYLRLGLRKKGEKQKNLYVHSLIYTTFKGPIPPGMHVDHLNNIKTDNRPENLQLLTPADNTRKALKGKKLSEAHKVKISAAQKGRIPWNKDKKLSEEIRAKLSAAKKGKKRKPHTEETKAKMSAAAKARHQREKNLSGITC